MARLPTPGSDSGQWGTILNDFLTQAHNTDGTLKDTGVVAQKYTLPDDGIPESDLADAVQTKLNSGGVPDADATTKGVIQLAGDLSGTSSSPAVADGAITNAKVSASAAIDQSKLSLDSDLTTFAGLSPTNDDVLQRKSGAWTNRSMSQLKTDLSLSKSDVGLGNVDNVQQQPIDSDLTDISALSPTNDDILQRKAGAWTNRTMAQLKTDLSLSKSDVALGNVDNTADTSKPVSTAQQTALDLKEDLSNKSTTTTLGTSNTLYPTQNAVKTYVDTAVGSVVATKTGAYVITTSDSTILADTTSAGFAVTLPTAVGSTKRYTIKKIASANTLTIDTTSSQTIDGSTSIAITAQYESISVVSDNSNWHVV